MKALLTLVTLLVAAAASVSAIDSKIPKITTEFSIDMGVTGQSPSLSRLVESDYYVSTESGFLKADLITKTVAWNYTYGANINPYECLNFYTHNSAIVLVCDEALIVLNQVSGAVLNADGNFQTNADASQITFGTSGNDVIVLTQYNIYVVDTVTGKIVSSTAASGALFGSILYFVNSNGELEAREIGSSKSVWVSKVSKNFVAVEYADLDWVVASTNEPNGDTIVYVIDRNNGDAKLKEEALNGVSEYKNKVKIVGTNLTLVAGVDYARLYTIDINTGYILSIVPYSSGGSGSGNYDQVKTEDGSYLRVATNTPQPAPNQKQGFEIQLSDKAGHNFKSGSGCGETSSSSGNQEGLNIEYYGEGAFKIGNLQGWTFWYIDLKDGSCQYISANYFAPNWTPNVFSVNNKYNGAYIEVEGEKIVATKITFPTA